MKTPEEIGRLAQDCLDGNLDDAEQREFFELAKSDREVMRSYCVLASMDASLRRFATGEVSLRNLSGKHSPRRRTYQRALVAAVALLLVGALVLRLIHIPEKEFSMSYEASAGSVFEVTYEGAGPEGAQVLELGARVKLKVGTMKLLLENGVESVVEGPADITLSQDGVVFLDYGIAWFRVPEGGEGFTVRSKHVEVVDLGTEFGIVSRKGRLDEVHLIEGKVDVKSLHALMKGERLEGKAARKVDAAGRLKEVELDEGVFRKALPAVKKFPSRWTYFGGVDEAESDIEGSMAPLLKAKTGAEPGMGLNGFFPKATLQSVGDKIVVKGAVIFSGADMEAKSASLNMALLKNSGGPASPIWSGYRISCAGPQHGSHFRWLDGERHPSPASGVGQVLRISKPTQSHLENGKNYQFFLSATKQAEGLLFESSLGCGELEFAHSSYLHPNENLDTFNAISFEANRALSADEVVFREVEVVLIPAATPRR